jgi:hypothetical protein
MLVDGIVGGFGGIGLLRTQGAESGKELVVNCTCVVEESANDALNYLDAFCGERTDLGSIMGELGGLAIDNFVMLVRRELALDGHGMLVLGADIADVSWHGEAT